MWLGHIITDRDEDIGTLVGAADTGECGRATQDKAQPIRGNFL